jgi:hypothetical protein
MRGRRWEDVELVGNDVVLSVVGIPCDGSGRNGAWDRGGSAEKSKSEVVKTDGLDGTVEGPNRRGRDEGSDDGTPWLLPSHEGPEMRDGCAVRV